MDENMNNNTNVDITGLLPPHEQMLDLATYGPVLIAKEECILSLLPWQYNLQAPFVKIPNFMRL